MRVPSRSCTACCGSRLQALPLQAPGGLPGVLPTPAWQCKCKAFCIHIICTKAYLRPNQAFAARRSMHTCIVSAGASAVHSTQQHKVTASRLYISRLECGNHLAVAASTSSGSTDLECIDLGGAGLCQAVPQGPQLSLKLNSLCARF